MRNFEVFTKRLVPLRQAPYVTVQRKGILSLNLSAYEALGRPAAVELLYDTEAKVIGVRGVDPDVEHAYPVRPSGSSKDSTFLVSGIAFAKYYGIEATTARRYPAEIEDGVLCVELSSGGTDVTGPRGARRVGNS